MKSQAYRMAMLYDFYGDVLTDRQKEFYDLYYNEDLSLGEIAENYGITRQGVRDVIVRAEAILTELEDKTGLIKRFHTMHSQLEQLRQDAQQLVELAAQRDQADMELLDCAAGVIYGRRGSGGVASLLGGVYADVLCWRYLMACTWKVTAAACHIDERTAKRYAHLAMSVADECGLVG